MRSTVIVMVLALAGCAVDSAQQDSDPSALYSINGPDVSCRGATWQGCTGDPAWQACRWDCVNWDGQLAKHLYLSFRRSEATWVYNNASIELGDCP
jgi:hypothetical protein